MDYPIRKLLREEFPPMLREIPQPPKDLFLRGCLPPSHFASLAVVGSRNYSNYGSDVVNHLIQGLKGYPVAIVSGLALGIDALAHAAALKAGLYTLSVPGSGLDNSVLYPRSNRMLAMRILESGGGLLSEYDPFFAATPWSFPQRNRIMAGLSSATLVIEASQKSGTLITARLAVDYNRELLVVPGNIFNENSQGPHQFLKLGATPVTSSEDILDVLGISHDKKIEELNVAEGAEATILKVLTEATDRDSLIRALGLPVPDANVLLMNMELNGRIRESNGVFYKC